jgi:hypothetical protein
MHEGRGMCMLLTVLLQLIDPVLCLLQRPMLRNVVHLLTSTAQFSPNAAATLFDLCAGVCFELFFVVYAPAYTLVHYTLACC